MKVLLADDEEGFLDQTEIFLKGKVRDLEVDKFTTAEKALSALKENTYDVIVSDYQMPGMDGLDFLEEVREERGIDIPFIIFTGRGREEVAIEALNLGADRYLQKGGDPKSQYGLLAEAVTQEYDRWVSQKKLERSEREKSLVLDSGSEHIAFHDPNHEIVWVNKAYSEDLGREKEEIEGKKCHELWYNQEEPCENCPVNVALSTGEESEGEISPPGSDLHWLIRGTPVRDEEGDVIGAIETALDITERRKAEQELEERNRQLETLFSNMPGMAYRCLNDEDWTMLFISDGCEELTGFECDDLIGGSGVSFEELILSEDHEYVRKEVESAVESKDSYELNYRIRTKSGETRWVWAQGRGIYNDDGELKFLEGFIQDFTESKMHEESLKNYKKAIEASDDSIYMVDKDFRYIFANEEHLSRLYDDGKISEISEEKVIGKKYSEVHPEKEISSFIEKFENVLETGEPVDEEYEFLKGHRWSGRTFSPVKEPGSEEFSGVVVVSKDITGRKKAEESREFLHSLLRHDVRNKIQVLNGYSELLSDMDLSEEAETYLEKSKKVAGDTIDLIEKVRALRRTESEEVREIDVEPLLRDVIQSTGASSSGIDIQFSKDDSLDSCLVMAGPLLSRVFSNLLDNAVQHSGGDKITISVETSGEDLICRVEDNGRGIPDDKKDKIFEKGYKGDENPGSGLGMFLVKKLIDTYDGSIHVKDSDLGGARFEIRLKRAEN